MSDDGSKTTQAQSPAAGDADQGAPDAAPQMRSTDSVEQLLDQTEAELASANSDSEASSDAGAAASGGGAPIEPKPFNLEELIHDRLGDAGSPIDILSDVDLDLRIELGRTSLRLEDVLQLRSGSVVALDRLAGDPVDVFVNDRLVARGEVLVLNDNFCVRVMELVTGGSK